MAVQLNQVVISGNLTEDPVLNKTNGGVPVCNFSIANNRTYKSGNERKQQTTFVHVSTFRTIAENVAQYRQKGDPVIVMGQLVLDEWEAKEGGKRSRLKIQAENVQFLPRFKQEDNSGDDTDTGSDDAGDGDVSDDPLND